MENQQHRARRPRRLEEVMFKTSSKVRARVWSTALNNRADIRSGIIEGETRVIISGMTMEEIFKERQVFKTKIIENVQSELDQFGLKM